MKSARNFNFFVLDKQCCMVETLKNTITEGHGTNEPSNIEPAPRQPQKLVLNVYGCYGLHSLLLPDLMGKYKSRSGDHTDDIRLSKLPNQTPWNSYKIYGKKYLEGNVKNYLQKHHQVGKTYFNQLLSELVPFGE